MTTDKPSADHRCINVQNGTCRPGWEIHECPNMTRSENDRDMEYENYDCKVCGKHAWLDYEEMK